MANADRLRDKNLFHPLPYWVVKGVAKYYDGSIVQLGERPNFLSCGISLLQFKDEYVNAKGDIPTLARLKVRQGLDLLTIRQQGLEEVKSQVPFTDAFSNDPSEINAAFWRKTESGRFRPSTLHLYAIYLGGSPTSDILKNWLLGEQAHRQLEEAFGEN